MAEAERQRGSGGGLSIVIPAYNREQLIVRCLESVLQIGVRPLEAVVMDDGSTDGTVAAAEALAGRFAEAEIGLTVMARPHEGAQQARNAGAAASAHAFVMFLDSDDYVDAAGVDAAMELAAGGAPELIVGVIDRVTGDGGFLETVGRPWTIGDKNRMLDYDWHTNGAIYRRDFFERLGGWHPQLKGSQDWEMQVRAKTLVRSLAFVPNRIAYWVAHEGNRIGTSTFRQEYTESVLVACGLILRQLCETGNATWRNQVRLAGRYGLHVDELRSHGVPQRRIAELRRKYYNETLPFGVLRRLPWGLARRRRQRCLSQRVTNSYRQAPS